MSLLHRDTILSVSRGQITHDTPHNGSQKSKEQRNRFIRKYCVRLPVFFIAISAVCFYRIQAQPEKAPIVIYAPVEKKKK